MAWVAFIVVVPPNSSEQDGQLNFTYTLSNNNQTLNSGAQLQYARDNHPTPPPNPTTIFTTTAAITANGEGIFELPDVTLTNNVNIPHRGRVVGGNYNTLTSILFVPGTSELSGVFKDVGIGGQDADCDWNATVST